MNWFYVKFGWSDGVKVFVFKFCIRGVLCWKGL